MKYPRTYHLPWSPGTTADDKKLSGDWFDMYKGKEIVITEKLDGENTAINHFDKFKKLWFFYLPFCTIFLVIFILPIPLSLIAWLKPENINAGMLWSLIIFGFICLLLSILNLIFVYKNNLNSLIYVTSNEEDNENKQKVKPIENEQ